MNIIEKQNILILIGGVIVLFNCNDERVLYTIFDKVWIVKCVFSSYNTIDFVNVYLRDENNVFTAVGFLTIDGDGTYYTDGKSIGKAGETPFFEYIQKLTGVSVNIAQTENPVPKVSVSFEEVCLDYKKTANIKKTAKNVGISEEKTRKILITEGVYTNEKYENIKKLLSSGKTLTEVSEHLNMSIKQIRAHLPYNK